MRKLGILFFLLFIVATSQAQFSGDTWEKAQQTKQANLVLTYTHAPSFAEKVGGEYKGLCFDIMRDFVQFVKGRYGITVNLQYKDLSKPQDFDLFLNTIKASKGGVIGLGDVTITQERKQFYNFSPAYFSNVAIMVTNDKAPNLTSLENISRDFAGMKAVVQNGTTHEARIKSIKQNNFPSLEIETTVGFNAANKKVAQDPNYFTYFDFSTYLDVLEQKFPVKRQAVGDEKGESFGFIMPKSSDWGPVLKEFFAQDNGYTESTQYRKLMADNLGSAVLRLLDAMAK